MSEKNLSNDKSPEVNVAISQKKKWTKILKTHKSLSLWCNVDQIQILCRKWCIKFATGLNTKIDIIQKVNKWLRCSFAKMILPWGDHFGKKTVWTLILFELCLSMIFSPVANLMHHPLDSKKSKLVMKNHPFRLLFWNLHKIWIQESIDLNSVGFGRCCIISWVTSELTVWNSSLKSWALHIICLKYFSSETLQLKEQTEHSEIFYFPAKLSALNNSVCTSFCL